jgi:hypothetical protein
MCLATDIVFKEGNVLSLFLIFLWNGQGEVLARSLAQVYHHKHDVTKKWI